jgi:hypothetical protein
MEIIRIEPILGVEADCLYAHCFPPQKSLLGLLPSLAIKFAPVTILPLLLF